MASISKTSALVEAIARATKKEDYNKVEMKGDFPQQDAFINDTNKFVGAQCSRRSGKSTGLAIRFFKAMENHPKSQSLYLALTQDSARSILWPVLQEIDDKYKIGCTFTESKLEVTHPNGAKLKLMGADLKNFIKRLRGRKYPAVAIDEVQDMGVHVESLIDDVLSPSIADYKDGWIAVTGTPGPVPKGYFFELTEQGKHGYSVHKWTILDNPHMPDPQGTIDDIKTRKGWDETNPTLLREWRNKWVLDTNSLWIRYKADINDYQILPKDFKGVPHRWNYIMGVDMGFNDADAIAVLAWSETSKETYLVEELLTRKQGVSALMDQIEAMQKKYGVYKIVMDEGGLGKKAAEDYRSRFAVPLEAADKAKKQTNVELLNDALRLGNFKAKSDSQFATDSYLVQINWEASTPNKIVLKKNYHSDVIDAVLYAFRESYAHTGAPKPPPPAYGSKAWARQQEVDMFEAALDHYSTNAEAEKDPNAWIKTEK